MEPQRVTQVGAHNQCGKRNCPVKSPGWRVILGHWVVQVYVCSEHLVWACKLDMISQNTGEAMGWHHGYPVNGGSTMESRTTKVTPNIPVIVRTDYTREIDVSDMYPKCRMDENGNVDEHVYSA